MKRVFIALFLCAALCAEGACRFVKLATLSTATDRRAIVEGEINGHAAKMLVDTGAMWTSLTRTGVEKFDIQTMYSGVRGVGIGGESLSYRARVEQIALGAVKGGPVTLHVIWSSAQPFPFDAIVGAETLFRHDVEVAFADRSIAIFQPLDCGEAPLAYWDSAAPYVPMAPMSERDQRRVVTVSLNGKEVRAVIDTGASSSLIDVGAAARAGVTLQTPGVVAAPPGQGIGEHPIKSWIAPFESFAIGGEKISNPRISIADLFGAAKEDVGNPYFSQRIEEQPEMLLGADFFRSHRVLLAVSQNRMYFTYLGGPVFASK